MPKITVRVREFAKEHTFGPHFAGEEIELEIADLQQPHIRAAVITLDEERAEKEARETALADERRARMEASEQQRQSAIAAQKLSKAARRSTSPDAPETAE